MGTTGAIHSLLSVWLRALARYIRLAKITLAHALRRVQATLALQTTTRGSAETCARIYQFGPHSLTPPP